MKTNHISLSSPFGPEKTTSYRQPQSDIQTPRLVNYILSCHSHFLVVCIFLIYCFYLFVVLSSLTLTFFVNIYIPSYCFVQITFGIIIVILPIIVVGGVVVVVVDVVMACSPSTVYIVVTQFMCTLSRRIYFTFSKSFQRSERFEASIRFITFCPSFLS